MMSKESAGSPPWAAGVGQRADDRVVELSRPRPSVQDQQRRRVRALSAYVEEVDRRAIDVDFVLGVGVQPLLRRSPVETIGPVLDQRLDVGRAQAVVLVLVVGVRGEPGGLQPGFQVVQDVLGDIDRERVQGVGPAVVAHGVVLPRGCGEWWLSPAATKRTARSPSTVRDPDRVVMLGGSLSGPCGQDGRRVERPRTQCADPRVVAGRRSAREGDR